MSNFADRKTNLIGRCITDVELARDRLVKQPEKVRGTEAWFKAYNLLDDALCVLQKVANNKDAI